jgi:guanylate kinase
MIRTGYPIERRGLMLVLSSPSGAGKTTLTRMLLQDPTIDLTLSVSVTTRARRSSEVDGIHYHFIDRAEFERRRQAGELLEWAKVHDHFYGSPRRAVEAILARGRDVLFDIDYQGTQQIQQKAPDDVVTVFILPPSMRELKARLERRAEDATEAIARRLQTARQEINRWALYDYVLVNEDLQSSFVDVLAILKAERLKRRRAEQGLAAFVDQLMTQPPQN